MKLTAKQILNKLEKNRDKIKRYSVMRIGLFGSFLKGSVHKGSDIDFIVKLKNLTFDNYIELKFALEGMFKRKVDLVIEDNLKPALKYIKEEARYAETI